MSSISSQNFYSAFKVLEKLGSGKQGNVYEIQEKLTGKRYALKLTELKSLQAISKAFQEVQVTKAMSHNQIVQLHYFFIKEHPKKHSIGEKTKANIDFGIIMEKASCNLLQDISLRSNTKQYFTSEEIFTFTIKMVNCLAQMQDKGYVHRDIKPENILRVPLYEKNNHNYIGQFVGHDYKLSDFGFAIKVNRFSSQTISGTEGYASPKIQIKMNNPSTKIPGNNHKDDAYSLGVTILQMCNLCRTINVQWAMQSMVSRYGKDLEVTIEAVRRMLINQEQQRNDFVEIRKYFKDRIPQENVKYNRKQPETFISSVQTVNNYDLKTQKKHESDHIISLDSNCSLENFQQNKIAKTKKRHEKQKMSLSFIGESLKQNYYRDYLNIWNKGYKESQKQQEKLDAILLGHFNQQLSIVKIIYYHDKVTSLEIMIICSASNHNLVFNYAQSNYNVTFDDIAKINKITYIQYQQDEQILWIAANDGILRSISIKKLLRKIKQIKSMQASQNSKRNFWPTLSSKYKINQSISSDQQKNSISLIQIDFKTYRMPFMNAVTYIGSQYCKISSQNDKITTFFGWSDGHIGFDNIKKINKLQNQGIAKIITNNNHIYSISSSGVLRKFKYEKIQKTQSSEESINFTQLLEYSCKVPILDCLITKQRVLIVTANGFLHIIDSKFKIKKLLKISESSIVSSKIIQSTKQNTKTYNIYSLSKNGYIFRSTYNEQDQNINDSSIFIKYRIEYPINASQNYFHLEQMCIKNSMKNKVNQSKIQQILIFNKMGPYYKLKWENKINTADTS